MNTIDEKVPRVAFVARRAAREVPPRELHFTLTIETMRWRQGTPINFRCLMCGSIPEDKRYYMARVVDVPSGCRVNAVVCTHCSSRPRNEIAEHFLGKGKGE